MNLGGVQDIHKGIQIAWTVSKQAKIKAIRMQKAIRDYVDEIANYDEADESAENDDSEEVETNIYGQIDKETYGAMGGPNYDSDV